MSARDIFPARRTRFLSKPNSERLCNNVRGTTDRVGVLQQGAGMELEVAVVKLTRDRVHAQGIRAGDKQLLEIQRQRICEKQMEKHSMSGILSVRGRQGLYA